MLQATTFESAKGALVSVTTKNGEKEWPFLEAIWKWVSENWLEIAKFLISVAPLIMSEKKR